MADYEEKIHPMEIDKKRCSKADLHVHSKYSKKPAQWFLRRLGCQESYSEPEWIYATEKSLGMDYVTITDHNVIDGSLEIAHHADVIIGEEITTYFPEDDCKIHVQVLGINERIHEDISKIRDNIYDLVSYLRGKNLVHYVTHPFYAINDRLKRYHIERLLLLFDVFEIVNGSRKPLPNLAFEKLLTSLNQKFLLELANKNPMPVDPDLSVFRGTTGGSDDHGGLFIGHSYTLTPKVDRADLFLRMIKDKKSYGAGLYGSPLVLAHSLYAIAYQFCKNDILKGMKKPEDLLIMFLDKLGDEKPTEGSRVSASAGNGDKSGVGRRIRKLIKRYKPREDIANVDQTLLKIIDTKSSFLNLEREPLGITAKDLGRWEAINTNYIKLASGISQHMMHFFFSKFLKNIKSFKILGNFNNLSALVMVHVLLLPYFFSYSHQNKDKDRIKAILKELGINGKPTEEVKDKRVWFSDTIFDINGVARTIQQMAKCAKASSKDLKIVACPQRNTADTSLDGVFAKFLPLAKFPIPEYEALKLYIPPILDIVEFCERGNFNCVISSTPGPMGLTALLVSKLLHIPINGIYHTDIPQYVRILTGDFAMEDMTWKYLRWYYEQMDVIFAPSKATRDQLVSNGFTAEKIKVFPRGIDIQRFNPRHKSTFIRKEIALNKGRKILYVGRVSKEKGIDVLIDAYLFLKERYNDLKLVVVGDGPYLETLKSRFNNQDITFTGTLEGEMLSEVYASSDIFVFPSTTDTFGNVVLEAQASGVPVIVADEGGPAENVENNKTGLIFKSGSSFELVKAVEILLNDEEKRSEMALNARKYMENRSFDRAFEDFWQMHRKDSFFL